MVLAEQQPSAESTAIFNPQILHNIHEAHQRNSYQYDASTQRFLECKYTVASHGFNSDLPIRDSFIIPTIEARL